MVQTRLEISNKIQVVLVDWGNYYGESGEAKQCSTQTPKVCRIMAFGARFWYLGLLFYILLGFR